MPQRKLQGRGCAGGGAQDRSARDIQCIEQTGVSVGLCRRRSVGWERRAKVTEARHGDHAQAAACQSRAEVESLIESSARAVDSQYRRPVTDDPVLNRPTACLRNLTARRDALTRLGNIALIAGEHQRARAGDEDRRENRDGVTCM
jgi:hypothetical protein